HPPANATRAHPLRCNRVTLAVQNCRPGACSSAGQSSCLLSSRSQVRILPGAPNESRGPEFICGNSRRTVHDALRPPRARYVPDALCWAAFGALTAALYLRFRQVTQRLGDLLLTLITAVQVDQRGAGRRGGPRDPSTPAAQPRYPPQAGCRRPAA